MEALEADARNGSGFRSMAERVKGERAERMRLAARSLDTYIPFLDHSIGGILPTHLILIGAGSGVGKSEIAQLIAIANARAGKRVHLFALEAENKEVERRAKYRLLCEAAFLSGRDTSELDFVDWYHGRCDHILGGLDSEIEYDMERLYANLFTFYKQEDFTGDKLMAAVKAIEEHTDLIVLDHLHYVDVDDDNENRGYTKVMKLLSIVPSRLAIPVIVVVHLRKADPRLKRLMPTLDEIHGSSNIAKVCTHSVVLARAPGMPFDPRFSHTLVEVNKDRFRGAQGLVALCQFDKVLRRYLDSYTLGRAKADAFEQLAIQSLPRWARGHTPMATSVAETDVPPPRDDDRPPPEPEEVQEELSL